MARLLEWDKNSERKYRIGVDRGVLYVRDDTGDYEDGEVWNGLVSVSESPTGAESTKIYADNIAYLNIVSDEEFAGSIEAYTYPDGWEKVDGITEVAPGLNAHQQRRGTFGFSWRTKIGNDVDGHDHGYEIHLVWEGAASVSEKTSQTINEAGEPETMSWEFTTTKQPIATLVDNKPLRPTAHMSVSSLKVSTAKLEAIEAILYGTAATTGEPPTTAISARLPSPDELIALMED